MSDDQRRYKRYLLGVLLAILTFNLQDSLALGLVLQAIKTDLGLSDTQLGLLSGIAFALFYAVMGVPIARWADRGDRVWIIALTAALWSVMVALCGAARSFAQLLLTRMAVGIGEAGCQPPAHSLIAEYFDRTERPRALGVYLQGGALSVVVGYFAAGWLNQLYGWRVMFVVLACPGVITAVVALLTLREPRRDSRGLLGRLDEAAPQLPTPALAKVAMALWRNRTFRLLLVSFSLSYFFSWGILQWQPSFFIRSFGMTTGEVGTWFAVIYGSGAMVGTYVGGELASRFAASNEPLQLRAMAVAFGAFSLLSALAYTVPSKYLAFCLIGAGATGVAAANGPMFATIQTLVPAEMRATSIALIYLAANLVGMGLGPLATGALSDALRPWAGAQSLRYSLILLSPGYLLCAWVLWRANRLVAADLSALSAASEGIVANDTRSAPPARVQPTKAI